jgi:hypothetical protein
MRLHLVVDAVTDRPARRRNLQDRDAPIRGIGIALEIFRFDQTLDQVRGERRGDIEAFGELADA